MAYLGTAFDPTAVEPSQDLAPIPAGEYMAIITDSEMRAARSGNGDVLVLTHQIIEGEFKGRLIWVNLNIVNANATAQSIAQRDLSAICHAVGITQAITDSEQLHNRPMAIRVEFKPADEVKGYRARNEVKAWKAIDGQQATSASTPRPAAPSAPAPARAAPPWGAAARG